DALHERLLLDVAGNVAWLRERGFRQVILLGNSGGGSLFAFYLAQAAKPPADRLARAPSGDRVPLGEVEMPAADGLVLLAAHLGEGIFLLDLLDPSVIDEASPTAVNPRPLGSIFSYGRDPIHGNYGEGLGRVMSARGWLSTWSGLQSNAALERTLPEVRVPTLVIAALADTDIYPSECRRAFEASAARDKAYAELAGADHYLRRAIEWVHRLDGDALFVISGGRDGATWEAAARAYRDAYARLLPEATAAGIRLAIEVIHPLRQDLSFINTLADARELARAAGRRGGDVPDLFES